MSLPTISSDRAKMPWLRVRIHCQWTVVEIRDAEFLHRHAIIGEIRRQLLRLVDEGHIRLLIELGEVRWISGEVIGTLAGLYRVVHNQRGRLGLTGLTPLFRDTLRICHLDQVIEIYADQAAAIGSESPPFFSDT